MVYQIDGNCGRLLLTAPKRTAKSLLSFFRLLGETRSKALRFVCSDMWQPYLKVIAKKAGQALHVLDRFHIMAKRNKAKVRAAEAKRLKQDNYDHVLKLSRWCLLKRKENLTEKQTVKLKELLQYNLQAVRTYLQKEDFQRFWEYRSPSWAACILTEWSARVRRSRIEPMKKVAKTLEKHVELILTDAQTTSACLRRSMGPRVGPMAGPFRRASGVSSASSHFLQILVNELNRHRSLADCRGDALTEPERTSPAANTPARLVSSRNGCRRRDQCGDRARSTPVRTKPLSSRSTSAGSQSVRGTAPMKLNSRRQRLSETIGASCGRWETSHSAAALGSGGGSPAAGDQPRRQY